MHLSELHNSPLEGKVNFSSSCCIKTSSLLEGVLVKKSLYQGGIKMTAIILKIINKIIEYKEKIRKEEQYKQFLNTKHTRS